MFVSSVSEYAIPSPVAKTYNLHKVIALKLLGI